MADPWGYLNSQPEPDPSPDPWGYLDLDGQVRRAAQRHGVDPGLLGAMVHQESAGDPAAVSPKGARGLLQVMPDTARGLGYRPEDMADPEKNLDAGAAYMGQMLQRYGGDRKLALAAYNAGPGAVDKHGGVPPYLETQNYVRQVQAKAGPPADPWGYLGAPPAPAPREKPPAPAPPAAPAWAFSPSGDLSPGIGGLLSGPPSAAGAWEYTGSPLLQKRRRPDGSYETRPTPQADRESAVGVEPEPGIGARLGALANRGITAAAEGIAYLPDLATLLPDGPAPSAMIPEQDIPSERPVPTSAYAQIGKPGGFFDLAGGRADIHRQYQEAKDTLRNLPPVGDQPPWAVALADTLGEAGQLVPFGEGAKAARGALPAAEGEKLAQALTGPGPHNAEELALLARRAKVMPSVPGAVEPFIQPGTLAESFAPESKILGIGEHATEADQLQHLGMRAAPEDARALERVSAGIGEPGWVPPEPPPDPWGYLGKPEEPLAGSPPRPIVSPEPANVSPLVRNPPSDEGAILQSPSGRMVPVRGADSAVTERGTRVAFDYRVREAADLVTSHDDALRPRADFPAELQPRDRSRITSEAQVSRIEKNLDPEQLGASPRASNGLDLLTRAAGDVQGDLFHQPAPLAAAVREIPSPGAPEFGRGAGGEPHRLLTMEDVLPPAEGGPIREPARPPVPLPEGKPGGPIGGEPRPASPPPKLPSGLITGTKHAVTRAERVAAGLPEVERLAARESPSWEEAKAIYNERPEEARVLAEHVRKNPRQLTDVENDVLLHDRMSLTLDYREALAKEEAALKGDSTAAALATESRKAIEAAHAANTEALDKAGTVWGRAGQARQKLAAEDYSAINLNRRYAVANGGEEAPTAVRQKLADLSSQLEAAQARVVAAEEKAQQLQASRLIAEEQRQAGKASRSGARAKSKAQLEAEYKDLGAQLRAATHVQANLNPEQVAVLARQVRNRVQAGVTNLGDLVDTIYTGAKPFISDLEPRDVRDVIAGAGQTPKATRSQLTKDLARLKSQSKLLNKLDDVYEGLGLPAAAKRTPPSPEVAALREKLGQVTEDLKLKPALSDQQRLTRIQRALETKIERVERGILPARRARVSSPEVEALRKTLEQKLEEEGVLVGHDTRVKAALANAEERLKAPGLDPHTRELLRGEVDRWKAEMANPTPGRGPLTEAERLAGAKSRTTARIADLEAQIKAGEFPSRGRAPVPADEALLKARGELAGLRHQADRIIAAREAANRTGLQKAMDWTPGWGRFIKLSGVSTLQKLGAAAAERSLIFRPLEEFIGGGLSKLPLVRHFAAEAPIEGGASLSALAKNYAGFFGRQAREESMALLKGGEGPLDMAFGKLHGNPAVPSWMEYPGKVHGAIKAPAKVAGYQYAMEKQARWYLARGEGDQLLNPLVQAEMKARAWEHAQRDIFMGDNAFVSAFQEALRDKPGQTQVTKAVKSGGRVLFPIVKVPTNYTLELTDYAAGIPKAAGRMANVISAGAKATPEGAARDIASLVRAGLQEVGPEEAGLIMRQLKKGTLGAGLIALGATGVVRGGGYYEPGKHRSPQDLQPGELSIAGMRVPHMILHHPAIEALQIGAEIHRQRTIGDGLKNAARGVAEGVPFYGEVAQTGRQDLGQFLGGIERGLSIPPDVQRLARVMDQRGGPGAGEKFLQELGWLHIQANRRKPTGGPLDRLWKEEELGLPGLRQNVR